MVNRQIIGHIFSSRDFVYLVQENAFISKIKDTPQVLRQLWHDDIVSGFGIRSTKTGNVAFFVLKHIEKDEDQKAKWWSFEVQNPDDDPKLRGLTVSVFAE